MRFNFQYPALIRGVPPRCKNVRNSVVWMDGEVDVPEVSSHEIPVACRIESNSFFGEYRYHDGRFLKSCTPKDSHGVPLPGQYLGSERLSFSRTVGIEQMMGFELSSRWFDHQPILKEPVWPTEERGNIDKNESLNRGGWFSQELVDQCALPIGRFTVADLSAPQQDDIEHHEATARRLADGVICIDGTLWSVADEPLLFLEPVTGDPLSVMDMGWLEKSSGWSVFHPKLYGGSRDKPEMKNSGKLGYWNWKAFALPVTEHAKVAEVFALMGHEKSLRYGLYSPRVDVLMPEVFGHDMPELELNRVARAMCVHLDYMQRSGMLDYIQGRGIQFEGLAKIVNRIVSATSEEDGVINSTHLENQMDALQGVVSGNMVHIQGLDDDYSRSLDLEDMPARIRVLLDDFADRPMRMPETSAGPERKGPAF
jgi:hypothetical protein